MHRGTSASEGLGIREPVFLVSVAEGDFSTSSARQVTLTPGPSTRERASVVPASSSRAVRPGTELRGEMEVRFASGAPARQSVGNFGFGP